MFYNYIIRYDLGFRTRSDNCIPIVHPQTFTDSHDTPNEVLPKANTEHYINIQKIRIFYFPRLSDEVLEYFARLEYFEKMTLIY